MSLPPELRVLCFQLSSIPAADLPRHIPVLLQHVQCCQVPLSLSAGAGAGSAANAETSNSAVLVHSLKTHISTLLTGKSIEGRFTAVVLIKAVVGVGGWEMLQASESWVRGLLSILGKPDPIVIKELCVIALTKIFLMTHQYQTLHREITTPTLPTFISTCLSLLSTKATKFSAVPSSLVQIIFGSFAMLVPRHTSIFRPFTSQLRVAIRRYLAPTTQDDLISSEELKESSRELFFALFQTAAKNTGSEEWGRAVREILKDIHITADNVFRAVVEDWESTSGYSAEPVDVNKEPRGGGKTIEDLSPWSGILAGTDRLVGLLELLAGSFRVPTPGLIMTSLVAILDAITRMLTITVPSSSDLCGTTTARLHPAIGREERDILYVCMPRIYASALHLMESTLTRLEGSAITLAQAYLDLLMWIFPHGSRCTGFRLLSYDIAAKLLECIGKSMDRRQVGKLSAIVRSCCQELLPNDQDPKVFDGVQPSSQKPKLTGQPTVNNADSVLRSAEKNLVDSASRHNETRYAAVVLLPLFLSHLPQQYLEVSVRSLIERTAIISKSKEAVLASILNPFLGKNGKPMASLLPHLSFAFGSDDVVELLLRPRMPLLPSNGSGASQDLRAIVDCEDEDEYKDLQHEIRNESEVPLYSVSVALDAEAKGSFHNGLGPTISRDIRPSTRSVFYQHDEHLHIPSTNIAFGNLAPVSVQEPPATINRVEDAEMTLDNSSDDESVHLTMQLDTDSDGDE